MKLALNIFAIRIILEAARGAVMWILIELFDLRARPRSQRRPIGAREPHPTAPFVHDTSTYL